MPVVRPGAIPSGQMDARTWAKWCGQKPLYEIATVTSLSFTANREEVILVNDTAAGGAVIVTLPRAALSRGLSYIIKKIGNTANVTIDATSNELIDGAATSVLSTQYAVKHLVCDGTGWVVI